MPPATCRSCQKRGHPLVKEIVRLFVSSFFRLVSHIKRPVIKIITIIKVLRPTNSLPTEMPPPADCTEPISQRCNLNMSLKKGNLSFCPFTSPV